MLILLLIEITLDLVAIAILIKINFFSESKFWKDNLCKYSIVVFSNLGFFCFLAVRNTLYMVNFSNLIRKKNIKKIDKLKPLKICFMASDMTCLMVIIYFNNNFLIKE